MKTDIGALVASMLLLLAGFYTARAQGWGANYYCDGPYLGCVTYACYAESGTCTNDQNQGVSFTDYATILVANFYNCGPMNNANCPQPWSINCCDVTFYSLPAGETICLDSYQVCSGYFMFKTCAT
jgi:hypothetical protein